nr:retrotransposon Orf1 [Tanacetum cinerariifolium]
MKLQEALDEEAILEEKILAFMHRFADRFRDRRVEINNLMVLHDHPLIHYGSITLWEDLTTRFLAQFFPPERTAKLRNDILMDFAKPVKAIALPQDVPSTFDRRLIELENQVQRLMEAHLAPSQPTQVNKITTSCEIYSGPTTLRLVSNFMASQDARLSKFEANFKQQQSEMTNKIDTVLKAITDRIAGAPPSDMVKNPKLSTPSVLSARSYPKMDPQCSTHVHGKDKPEYIHFDSSTPPDPSVPLITEKFLKFNSFFESLGLVPPSSNTELICTKKEDGDVMFIVIVPKDDASREEEPKAREQKVEYYDIFPTKRCPLNLKIPCNIGHVHVEKAYIDHNSSLNIMTRMMYNWIMKENSNRGVCNFTRRIKGMHVLVGKFTYVIEFMIVEDISSIIDPGLSQVVLGKPFVEISNMTHDPSKGVVRFTKINDELYYKMPHKIEQYNSLSNLEKEHTKSVYLRNDEDKRRGIEYVMSKILGFYKECLELGPEYLTGMDDEGKVT